MLYKLDQVIKLEWASVLHSFAGSYIAQDEGECPEFGESLATGPLVDPAIDSSGKHLESIEIGKFNSN